MLGVARVRGTAVYFFPYFHSYSLWPMMYETGTRPEQITLGSIRQLQYPVISNQNPPFTAVGVNMRGILCLHVLSQARQPFLPRSIRPVD